MFMEMAFLLCMMLFLNRSVVANMWVFMLLFLKSLLWLPGLSFTYLKVESSLSSIDKMGTLLTILTVFSVMMIFMSNPDKTQFFYFLNKVLLISLVLVFVSSNFLIFYFFFEVTIIPTIMMIIIWGYQPERLQAAFYFFFYTILASLPLLLFIILIFGLSKSSTMIFFSTANFSNVWWLTAILAFLVKFPMFFFHLWLPKAHVEAPLGGSMILAAVLLKLGGIGIFRVMMMFKHFISSSLIASMSIWGSILTAVICLQQSDVKAMIAYSSVAHMSFLISGMFLGTEVGMNGAMLMMFLHGFSSAALFMLAKMMYDFSSSRAIILNKGKMNLFPMFGLFWALLIVMNMGIPPASSFWSEIFLLLGTVFKSSCFNILFFLLAFFSTVYSCFLMISIHHGKLLLKTNSFMGFNKSNFCPMFIFSVFSFLFFIFPTNFFVV